MEDLLFFISLYFVRPLTVLIHELGHAIPLVILTRQPADVYVGSYGTSKGSMRINLRILKIYLRYNPLGWNKGVCIPHAATISIRKQIAYILAGPIASLTVAALTLLLFPFKAGYSYPQFFVYLFLASAIFDLFHNLIPRDTPIVLDSGATTLNDGKHLQNLFQIKKFRPEFEDAIKQYNDKNYSEASVRFQKLIQSGLKSAYTYKLALSAIVIAGPTEPDLLFVETFYKTNAMDADDLSNAGLCCVMLHKHIDGRKYLTESLEKNPKHLYSNANLAFTELTEMNTEKALELFTRVTQLDSTFSYGFSNRGLSKIQLGQETAGLEDIAHAITLNPEDSYAYRSYGIYYLRKQEFQTALEHLQKAKELYSKTYGIDELIRQATVRQEVV
jgi:hypothetical protein